MKKFELDNFLTTKEVIDGVTVIHSGLYAFVYGIGGKPITTEYMEMYDTNGNRFYSNFDSIEEANEAIARLEKEGKTAIIGPKAPWINYRTGKLISNSNENAVGLYIISTLEKNDNFSLRKTKKI